MKSFFAIALAIVAIPFAMANPEPQNDIIAPTLCLDVCLTTKPVCAVGYAPTGSEGCWGCCKPVCRRICPIALNSTTAGAIVPVAPLCLPEETLTAADSITGCWGCCKPACGSVCSTLPIACPLSMQAVGSAGCYSCCPTPIVGTL